MDKVYLVGYSGHGFVVADVLLKLKYEIAGYFEIEEKKVNPFKLTYMGNENNDNASALLKNKNVALGIGSNLSRKYIHQHLKAHCNFITAIHPNAVIANSVQIGEGTVIMVGSVINALASIGEGVICNTGCIIEHECKIGNYCHVAPGAVLAGGVQVGDRSFIGANSVIRQGITIGADVVIGAGSVIVNDIPNGVTVYGNPGRKLIK